MANELTVSLTVTYTPSDDGQVTVAPGEFTKTINMTGDSYTSGTQTITQASEDTVNVGDLSSMGWALIKNLDDTNFVEFNKIASPAGAEYTFKLKAGEFCWTRLGQGANVTVLKALADTADVDIQYWIWED